MNEIKAPLTKRIKEFIMAHIFAIGLILMGVMVLFSSCGKAHATEYTPNETIIMTAEEIVENYASVLNSNPSFKSSYLTICQQFASEFDYYNVYYGKVFNSSSDCYCITFYNDDYLGIMGNNYFVTSGQSFECAYAVFNQGGFNSFRGTSSNGEFINGVYRHFWTSLSYRQVDSIYWLDGSDMSNARGIALNLTYNGWYQSINSFRYLSNINLYTYGFGSNLVFHVYDNNLNVVDEWEPLFSSIVYAVDERLKMTIVNDAYGNKVLLTDIRQIVNDFPIQDTSASSNELDNNTLILTVVKDLLPETITLNTSNSNITDKYIFRTPLSVFNINESEDVYISDVSFSISGSGQSIQPVTESYNILTEFYLNKVHNSVESGNIPHGNDVEGEKLTSEEIQAKQYLIDFNSGKGLTFNEYHNVDKPDFFEDDAYYIYLSDGGSLQRIIEVLSLIAGENFMMYIDNIDTEVKLVETIETYMVDNAITQMCSLIVFVYIDDWTDFTSGNISSDTLTYYYYVTTYGRIRQVNQQLADMYIAEKQLEVNSVAIYERINDFENQTLLALTGSGEDSGFTSVFYNLNKLDNDLLSGITQIIDAMPTYEPYNDSTVTSLLGDITTLLAEIIHNQESPTDGYPRYISWVKEFNDLDGFGNWSDSVLDTFKNIYSFFNYRTDINIMETGIQTYITYVNEYVDMLLGNNESSLEIESRYYMSIFDGTYDINNINGGGN